MEFKEYVFEPNVMSNEYMPGYKAGNPFIDKTNESLIQEELRKREKLERKILFMSLAYTLEEILEIKMGKDKLGYNPT